MVNILNQMMLFTTKVNLIQLRSFMKPLDDVLHQCYLRVLNQETIVDIAVGIGLIPSTLGRYLIDYTSSIGKYREYHSALEQQKKGKHNESIAVNVYDEQGNLIKTYSSIAKAERDTGIQYYKIKQLLKEGKLWKLA